jgi:two-component system LytT family response regulator
MRVAIVEPEEAERERMRSLLTDNEDVKIVGEFGDGAEALPSIRDEKPDVVFLEAHGPTIDGFELVEEIDRDRAAVATVEKSWRPAFVFVSACADCAVKAFELRALDFVLKPLKESRFEKAVTRARHYVDRSRQEVAGPPHAPKDDLPRSTYQGSKGDRVIVRSGDRVLFLRSEDIDWIESAGNYVRVHALGECYEFRGSMKNVERRLDPRSFARIHRSAIVNFDRIRELTRWAHSEFVVTLVDGTRLHASRVFAHRLADLIESYGL